ncbi:ATP synthase subunit I [Pseudothermotoga sp. U03pept]|uniref:ATP synthase subunit I n=1 Tax=Pseudothermotoga sp. U03pept TaxID=3447012 RepID=UPI003EFCE941
MVFWFLFGYRSALGVLLGTTGAIINVLSLWRDVEKCVARKKKMSVIGYLSRYTFSGAIMALAAILSVQAVFGAFFGLLNEKLAAFLSWR